MRYLEDVGVGESVELGSVVVDREELIAFAQRYDPQLFHVDDDAAAQSPFGGVIASGWHTGAMFSRLCVDGFLNEFVNLGGQGFSEVRFLAPVRPGDRLWASLEVLEARPSESRPDRGTLTVLGTLRDQEDRAVFTMQMSVRVARRPETG
ncbi:MAG: MaoC family dehydratase [Solirubrobacterales bacterium]|nr:MaoC family dehydratase [Solirubrobacterales bacterium]